MERAEGQSGCFFDVPRRGFPESPDSREGPTDDVNRLCHARCMPKKDGTSSSKTIEQVREATQADIKRVKHTPAREDR